MRFIRERLQEVWEESPEDVALDYYDTFKDLLLKYENMTSRFESSLSELNSYLQHHSEDMMHVVFEKKSKLNYIPSYEQYSNLTPQAMQQPHKWALKYIDQQQLSYSVRVILPAYIVFDWMEASNSNQFSAKSFILTQIIQDIALRNALQLSAIGKAVDVQIRNPKESKGSGFELDKEFHKHNDLVIITINLIRLPTNNGEEKEYDLAKVLDSNKDFMSFISFVRNELSEPEWV